MKTAGLCFPISLERVGGGGDSKLNKLFIYFDFRYEEVGERQGVGLPTHQVHPKRRL